MTMQNIPSSRPSLPGPLRSEPFETLSRRIGEVLGHSSWTVVEQEAVDAFAVLTGDANPAHVGCPDSRKIAHGFLTLSLIAQMAYEVCPGIQGTRQVLNYGFDRVRFTGPVECGKAVRGRFFLAELTRIADRWQASYDVSIEVQDQEKPALVARWITVGLMDQINSPI